MNKINRVITKVVFVAVSVVGVLNVVDYIYASAMTNAATSNLTMSATVADSVTINLSSGSLTLNPTPTSNGTFVTTASLSSPFTVSIYTNSSTGFVLGMTTSSTNLTSGSNSIATLSTSSTADNFTKDRWGYSKDGTNYLPVATSNTIGTYTRPSSNAQNGQTVQIDFGVKLSLATPPGNYSNTMTFTATAAP